MQSLVEIRPALIPYFCTDVIKLISEYSEITIDEPFFKGVFSFFDDNLPLLGIDEKEDIDMMREHAQRVFDKNTLLLLYAITPDPSSSIQSAIRQRLDLFAARGYRIHFNEDYLHMLQQHPIARGISNFVVEDAEESPIYTSSIIRCAKDICAHDLLHEIISFVNRVRDKVQRYFAYPLMKEATFTTMFYDHHRDALILKINMRFSECNGR